MISKSGAWIESVRPYYETKEVKRDRPKGILKLWDWFKTPFEFEYKRVQAGFICDFGVGGKSWTIDHADKTIVEKFRKNFIKQLKG